MEEKQTYADFAAFWQRACLVTSDLEKAGCYFDTERCKAAHAKSTADLHEAVAGWHDHAGDAVNPASPKQLAEFLYGARKFPLPPIAGGLKAVRARKREESPTSEAALDWLYRKAKKPENQALLRSLLELRKVTKYVQFLDKLGTLCTPGGGTLGHLFASFGPDTGTGRLASRNPNLQNIPGSDPYGIRSCFVAPAGFRLLVADFAALEPRLLAHYLIVLFDDHSLHDAIESGDVYGAVACRTWPGQLRGIAPDEIKHHPNPAIQQLRKFAKIILLGTNYGKTVSGLAVQLDVAKGQAQKLYDDYFTAYPGIRKFQDWAWTQVRAGKLATLLGRSRTFSCLDENRARRQATNTVIQGSAADVVFAAMVAQSGLGGTLQLQIHDELVWRVPEGSDVAPLISAMEHPFTVELQIPLRVEWKLCNDWSGGKD